MKVLVSAPYMQQEWEWVAPWFAEYGLEVVLPEVDERLEEAELLELITDVDGVICGDDRFTPRVIDAAERLQVIVKWGTGIDSIDKVYAESRGIAVKNTLDAFTEPVSDSAVAYMLAFCRKIVESDRILKAGDWTKPGGITLGELTIGIVGLGRIGCRVAEKLRGFGPRLLGTDIREIAQAESLGVVMLGLPELLEQSDIVTLHCDLNPTSNRIIGRDALGAMKPSALLVNTARGPLVEEQSLVEALQTGRLAGASLDVFEQEPLPAESPLRSMQKVMLAAHASNASRMYWRRVHGNSFRMLIEALKLCRR
jgi:phosphoglycerate dehydrogenase-like enzyme